MDTVTRQGVDTLDKTVYLGHLTPHDPKREDTDAMGTDTLPDTDVWSIQFPAYRLEAFNAKIATANGRLERAGADVRFSPAFEEFATKKVVGGVEMPDGSVMFGTVVDEPWIRATMAAFDLTVGDYSFIASLVREEAGYTVHSAPEQNLDGWTRPDDAHCDHCGTDRQRTRLYIVRENSTGRLVQLGHSCIELYLGLHPKGLWALQYGEELQAFASEDTGGGFSPRDYAAEVRKVLAYGYVFSDHGRDYQSTKVREWGRTPTVDVVRGALFSTPRPPKQSDYRGGDFAKALEDYRQYLEDIAEADRVWREDSDLLDAITAAADAVKAGTDYGDNLRVILQGERVSGKSVGILASLVSVYAREKEIAVKRAAAPKPAAGFLAPVKTRIKTELRLTLRTVRYWDGDYGTTSFLVGYTPDQHCVVWKASGYHDMEAGDTLVLSAATVKAHETYEGTDQTVITRAVIADVERAGEEEDK